MAKKSVSKNVSIKPASHKKLSPLKETTSKGLLFEIITAPLPPEVRMEMPVQSFERWSKKDRYHWQDHDKHYTPWLARFCVFGGGLLVTAFGAYEIYGVVSVGGVTLLEWLLLILFMLNFSWIALAFSSAIVGFVSLMFNNHESLRIPPSLKHRTAIIMPIYNEAPSRVFGAMEAMIEDVRKTGLLLHFDFFLLSDTTDTDIWIAEERAFLAIRASLPSDVKLYYRRRQKNTARKAGNIADFVTRWGGAYAHMVVLDADSVMTGASIVGLAGLMEADADAGIIQTLPLIINRNTLFARVQQFAARIYGPVIAEGLRLWSGRDGNYWGHNAIIRTKAFADYAGMPDLKGKPPFGGHIMSHDFVEAALIRRAGYAVYMVPGLVGSYEESPPSLIDLAARDRRWCQGNLQHSRIIGAKGFHWATRQHFATGIMSYLASPLWLMQLVVGITIVLQSKFIRPEYFTSEFTLFPAWPRFDAERSLQLFGITMLILLAPKIFGLIVALVKPDIRKACGGSIKLTLSFFVEIIISALLAPVMMLIQSGAVFQILAGRDTGWKPQRRDDGSIPMRDIVRRHRSHVALGLIAGISAFMIAPSLFAWMSPTIIGLLLAIQISAASGKLSLGLWLKARGILVTPEEATPPPVSTRANTLIDAFAARNIDEGDAVQLIHSDENLRRNHTAMLPKATDRARGHFYAERALAEAKLTEATSIEEAAKWLQPKERAVVLTDRALLSVLAKLPTVGQS
jgi:membrane glycosyltransferase